MSIIKYVTLQKIVAHDFRYDPSTSAARNAARRRCHLRYCSLFVGDKVSVTEKGQKCEEKEILEVNKTSEILP